MKTAAEWVDEYGNCYFTEAPIEDIQWDALEEIANCIEEKMRDDKEYSDSWYACAAMVLEKINSLVPDIPIEKLRASMNNSEKTVADAGNVG